MINSLSLVGILSLLVAGFAVSVGWHIGTWLCGRVLR